MSNALKETVITFEEYLAGEREVEVRSEYVDGYIYAMAGASELHNTVATTFCAAIENSLKETCRVWQNDMKVIGQNQNKQHFAYYPDIMAACGENTGDQYARSNPILIVEVLSQSTKRVDLKEKYDNYIQIPSLIEYVVVSQDTPYICIFRRRNNWQIEAYYAEEFFTLESIGLTIQVKQVYRRVRKEVGLDVPYPMSNA